jgi:hypothetical protein
MAGAGAAREPGSRRVMAGVLVLLAVVLAYLPAILAGMGFVSDDFMILQRLRQADGLRGGAAFFGLSYYDYYRPLGFLSFAADWSMWRDWPAGYHAISLLLHLLNTLLVLLLARRLLGAGPAVMAAAIFGLHVANHEAVFWMSARFDLLATACALCALLAVGATGPWRRVAVALLYLAALLSKESSVALPIAAVAHAWLIGREKTAGLVRLFAWMGAAGLVYVLLRQASGLPSVGGPSRAPKLAALGALAVLQLALAHPAADAARRWLAARRDWFVAAAVLALAALGAVAAVWTGAAAMHGVFNSLGFAALHLASPVSVERWLVPLPWWIGLAGGAAALAVIISLRWLAGHAVPMFLVFFLVAAIVPVSSMTEGSRYLYLASVPVAMAAAWCLARLERRTALTAHALAAIVLVTFAWQVMEKGRDWLWASGMTKRAAATIVEAAGPGCRGAEIVLVTAPVRPRGVHANLNHEALSALGGCSPASLRTIVRMGYDVPPVDAAWRGQGLTLRVPAYAGGFMTSADFQRYVVPIGRAAPTRLANGFGAFEASPDGTGLVINQAVSPADRAGHLWFVFSRAELRPIAATP